MRETNLFKWATRELSQDGFICWLMSFAKNPGINPQLEAVGLYSQNIESGERQAALKY